MHFFNTFLLLILLTIPQASPFHIFLIPLTKSTQNNLDDYTFYIENYSHPISLALNNAYTYLTYSIFTENYSNPSHYPHPKGTNSLLPEYYLYQQRTTFKGSSIPFTFNFYSLNQTILNERKYKDLLTLRYPKKQEEENLIYDLYKQQITKYKQFGLYLKKNYFIIGGIPTSLPPSVIHTIKLDSKITFLRSWEFNLKSFTMGNKIQTQFTYNIEYKFSLIGSAIGIPLSLFNVIKNEYFNTYINDSNKTCYVHLIKENRADNNVNSGQRIYCKNEVIESIPEVIFGFGKDNVGITVKRDALWNCNKTNDGYCLFELSGKDDLNNIIYVGTALVYDYLVMFDYENIEVKFCEINNENIVSGVLYEENDNLMLKGLIVLGNCIIMIGLIVITIIII